MYIALMNFDTLIVLVLRHLHKSTEVNAITAEVRLNGDALSLGFPIFQPLRFRHNRKYWSGLLALAYVYLAKTSQHA